MHSLTLALIHVSTYNKPFFSLNSFFNLRNEYCNNQRFQRFLNFTMTSTNQQSFRHIDLLVDSRPQSNDARVPGLVLRDYLKNWMV